MKKSAVSETPHTPKTGLVISNIAPGELSILKELGEMMTEVTGIRYNTVIIPDEQQRWIRKLLRFTHHYRSKKNLFRALNGRGIKVPERSSYSYIISKGGAPSTLALILGKDKDPPYQICWKQPHSYSSTKNDFHEVLSNSEGDPYTYRTFPLIPVYGEVQTRNHVEDSKSAYACYLIGGEIHCDCHPHPSYLKIAEIINNDYEERGIRAKVTTSRRTDKDFLTNLGSISHKEAIIDTIDYAQDGSSETKFYSFLNCSSKIYATSDSISMVNEALKYSLDVSLIKVVNNKGCEKCRVNTDFLKSINTDPPYAKLESHGLSKVCHDYKLFRKEVINYLTASYQKAKRQ